MNSQSEIRQRITDKIVEALKAGTAPWRKTWRSDGNCGTPSNAVSGRAYRGINILLLGLASVEQGFESKWWASYRQWQAFGGQVRRGEHGTQIIFYRPIVRKVTVNDDGEEKAETFPILRSWTVFNVAQVEGDAVEQFRSSKLIPVGHNFLDYRPAEEVITATGADIRFGGDRAFYSPEDDFIQLPPKSSFLAEHDFYHTAYHELAHWSGNEQRLARLSKNARFGSRCYAFEELVAEIGGCFLTSEVGVPQSSELSNQQAYLSHWLRVLENDPKAIFTAATQASAASDFILSFSRKPDACAGEEEEVMAGSVAE
jgi:antirestriction protein ArdC